MASGSTVSTRDIEGRGSSGVDHRPGSITAFVALMLVAIFALIGLVVDGGSDLEHSPVAVDEAEQAARAGAGALSVAALGRAPCNSTQAQAVICPPSGSPICRPSGNGDCVGRRRWGWW